VSHGNNVDVERLIGRTAEKAKRKRKEGPSEDVVEFMKKKTESLKEAHVQGEKIICLEKEKLQLEQLDREKTMDIELKNFICKRKWIWKGKSFNQNKWIEKS